ncbi:MAG: SPOR domain-containing protein [Duncaniella sp.]|nr:SPOR domain-containing protein [Duncaniella sp.]
MQFLTAPSRLGPGHRSFKGLKDVEHYRDGSTYKYTVGSYGSMAEASKALPKVKAKFPDAFVIKTRDGKRIK